MVNKKIDILIIGGGLTGATLMLALQNLGFSTLLVEAKPFSDKINPDFDARSLALSPASHRILNMLGVWDILGQYANPIQMIHVSDQSRFGMSRLHGSQDVPLGHVIEMQYINRALHQLLNKEHVIAPALLERFDPNTNKATILVDSSKIVIDAQLIVAADGADSAVRTHLALPTRAKRYNQQAIVANIGLLKSHENRAYERFTADGPLALLPMRDQRMSLVWALAPHKAAQLMASSEKIFLQELQQTFGYRAGRLVQVGKRFTFPLQQITMNQQAKWPVVFVGNAAHTLHPVAGQGFNLGLRDVATLAQCIAKQGLNKEMLEHYASLRQQDQKIMTQCTDGLIRLFTSRLPGVGLMRSLGLVALDNSTVLKNLLMRYAQGFGGITPDLVAEIALESGE